MGSSKVIWISWERHRRTLELARYLGVPPVVLICTLPRLFRYPNQIWNSVLAILSARPKTLIVQNPSVVLTLLACLLKKVFRYRLIVDAHNAGICPDQPLLQKLGLIYRYLQVAADVTVVTNRALADRIVAVGGVPFVLPDRIPAVPPVGETARTAPFTVVYICTFSPDEPYLEFFEATKMLGDRGLSVKVTGRVKDSRLVEKYPHISFTGFLPEDEYWRILKGSDVIVDLTKRDHCLLCGAYEGVAVGVPMVLTNTLALREYFRKGALFTGNSAREIANVLLDAEREIETLKRDVISLKTDLEREWTLQGQKFLHLVHGN